MVRSFPEWEGTKSGSVWVIFTDCASLLKDYNIRPRLPSLFAGNLQALSHGRGKGVLARSETRKQCLPLYQLP